jgi:phage FluMu protein gp41
MHASLKAKDDEKKKPGTGRLKHGLKIGGEPQFDFEVREGDVADLFAAEDVVPVEKQLQFDAALLCQRLVRVGTFEGPFTVKMLGRLKTADFNALRRAMAEAGAAGEPEPAPAPDA